MQCRTPDCLAGPYRCASGSIVGALSSIYATRTAFDAEIAKAQWQFDRTERRQSYELVLQSAYDSYDVQTCLLRGLYRPIRSVPSSEPSTSHMLCVASKTKFEGSWTSAQLVGSAVFLKSAVALEVKISEACNAFAGKGDGTPEATVSEELSKAIGGEPWCWADMIAAARRDLGVEAADPFLLSPSPS